MMYFCTSMKFAAIDIGSNAIRFQISSVLNDGGAVIFKKNEYVRFPLRLGHDVFTTGRISDKSMAKFKKLMMAYKLLIELYDVDDYRFCATSALRESENCQALVKEIEDELSLTIHIIDGIQEAELINKAIASYLRNDHYLHIDVGGGSTELNVYAHGKKTLSRSFKIGSVRILEGQVLPATWDDMEHWVKSHITGFSPLTAVGTGGNISKIFDLAGTKPGALLSFEKVKEIGKMIESYSLNDRIYKLQMNPDRADVIVPAGNIYVKVMEWASAASILVPEVGLKDGIILQLYENHISQPRLSF